MKNLPALLTSGKTVKHKETVETKRENKLPKLFCAKLKNSVGTVSKIKPQNQSD